MILEKKMDIDIVEEKKMQELDACGHMEIKKIKAFTEFWLDCYSTAIFSILLSYCTVKNECIYNNNYVYEYTKNVRTGMGRIYIKMQLDDITNKLLINREIHDFTKDDDIVANLKHYLQKKKIILLGIDMYYGVRDTSQWNKHHIHHKIIVEGYDDKKECMYILETGNSGYKEYELSYDDITLAAKNYNDITEIYDVNCQISDIMYDLKKLRKNARNIVQSIDMILPIIDEIWNVEEEKLLSMKDEIENHLRSIRNRQYVNQRLFEESFERSFSEKYINVFKSLENEYDILLNSIIESCVRKEYYQNANYYKNRISTFLIIERELWSEFSLDKDVKLVKKKF